MLLPRAFFPPACCKSVDINDQILDLNGFLSFLFSKFRVEVNISFHVLSFLREPDNGKSYYIYIYIYIDFDMMSKFRSILTLNYLHPISLISYINKFRDILLKCKARSVKMKF